MIRVEGIFTANNTQKEVIAKIEKQSFFRQIKEKIFKDKTQPVAEQKRK